MALNQISDEHFRCTHCGADFIVFLAALYVDNMVGRLPAVKACPFCGTKDKAEKK